MKARHVPRMARKSSFLDDPSEYPEFVLLTQSLPALHKLRRSLHVNRTAALVLLLGVSAALSGAPSPRNPSLVAWTKYLWTAIDVDRLLVHFEGFPSALACMGVISALSAVVFPFICSLSLAREPSERRSRRLATTLVVGIFFAAVWGIGVWGQSRFNWGFASGLWVGLYCACASMKVISFAVAMYRAAIHAARSPGGQGSTNGGQQEVGEKRQRGKPAESEQVLTFKEYLFFLFLAPAASCEIHLLKASARRPSRPRRAASEFLHAVLTFLVVHVFVANLMAPPMRLLTAALLSSSWTDRARWTAVEAAGHGGWPSWTVSTSMLSVGGSGGSGSPFGMVLGSFLWLLFVLSTVINFLGFYGFWHCVCLGMAELWGFPDRYLYGPWWLVFDSPQDFLRMWSTPVHRWLSSCIHWPLLGAAAGLTEKYKGSGAGEGAEVMSSSPGQRHQGNGGRNGLTGARVDGVSHEVEPKQAASGETRPSQREGWLVAVLSVFIVSIALHEAVVIVAFRATCWPFNTFLLCIVAGMVITWEVAFPSIGKQHGSVEAGCGEGGRVASPFGARGLGAALTFSFLAQCAALISEYVGWLWWRSVLMKD